jgi:hypothetical protein
LATKAPADATGAHGVVVLVGSELKFALKVLAAATTRNVVAAEIEEGAASLLDVGALASLFVCLVFFERACVEPGMLMEDSTGGLALVAPLLLARLHGGGGRRSKRSRREDSLDERLLVLDAFFACAHADTGESRWAPDACPRHPFECHSESGSFLLT